MQQPSRPTYRPPLTYSRRQRLRLNYPLPRPIKPNAQSISINPPTDDPPAPTDDLDTDLDIK